MEYCNNNAWSTWSYDINSCHGEFPLVPLCLGVRTNEVMLPSEFSAPQVDIFQIAWYWWWIVHRNWRVPQLQNSCIGCICQKQQKQQRYRYRDVYCRLVIFANGKIWCLSSLISPDPPSTCSYMSFPSNRFLYISWPQHIDTSSSSSRSLTS